MNCHESKKLMSAYVDKELDDREAALCADHIQNCHACTEEYEKLTKLHTTLKLNAANYKAPSHLRYRIQADLDSQKRPKQVRRHFSWNWTNFGLASACSLALAFSMYLYLAMPSDSERLGQEIVTSHYRSLLVNHLSDVVSSDQHTVKPWFTGKLDYSPPVVDFADQGFSLVGGRLDYMNHRTVAALVYRHKQHVINLFVWPDQLHKEMSVKTMSIQGFHILQWTHRGMAYSAISDMDIQGLNDFHRLLVRVDI